MLIRMVISLFNEIFTYLRASPLTIPLYPCAVRKMTQPNLGPDLIKQFGKPGGILEITGFFHSEWII
ncbi:MAG: hypothetical protein A2Z51_00555 [Deltaproteobacteria bacterium RBG_19FT_COMBO_52_11]|nr:MAG: hypothetical protein A2Z51_00555 [Deltaproteobacteria bacterium RBG_19FT_COMBO_52_11]